MTQETSAQFHHFKATLVAIVGIHSHNGGACCRQVFTYGKHLKIWEFSIKNHYPSIALKHFNIPSTSTSKYVATQCQFHRIFQEILDPLQSSQTSHLRRVHSTRQKSALTYSRMFRRLLARERILFTNDRSIHSIVCNIGNLMWYTSLLATLRSPGMDTAITSWL